MPLEPSQLVESNAFPSNLHLAQGDLRLRSIWPFEKGGLRGPRVLNEPRMTAASVASIDPSTRSPDRWLRSSVHPPGLHIFVGCTPTSCSRHRASSRSRSA